jgi:hypothetical protein
MQDLRYPIGRFHHEGSVTDATLDRWLDDITDLPLWLRQAVDGLDAAQLDTPYRPEGWTVRQVVHHLADSHLNSYIRFKWALTEETPTIKAYDEVAWARLPDYGRVPVPQTLDFLALLHARWVILLRSLDRQAFSRTFVHPASGPVSLGENVGIYAWHGRHHVAHITRLRERRGWT